MAVLDTEIKYYLSTNPAGDGTPSCGGDINTGAEMGASIHDLFDRISASEANGSNKDEYRLIYVKNTNSTGDILYDVLMDVFADSSSPSTQVAIGLDPAGANSNSTITLVDEEDSTNLLTGVTFVTSGSDLSIGNVADNDLAPDEIRAVWVRRSLTTPASSTPSDAGQLRVRGETA